MGLEKLWSDLANTDKAMNIFFIAVGAGATFFFVACGVAVLVSAFRGG